MELWQLRQMQSLPLEAKIEKTKLRIQEWYEAWDGQVYVSFSGGKDSTVLLHLVRSMYPEVPAVFVDTGLEYPEIREFVKSIDNVVWLRPKMNFREVIEKYGYPVISKEVANTINNARYNIRNGTNSIRLRQINGIEVDKQGNKSAYNKEKWKFILDAPFKVSDNCCNVMKKAPVKRYEKATKQKPYVGTMAEESRQRQTKWLRTGCNSFKQKNPQSTPLSFWKENDIWNYIKQNHVKYSKIYDMGAERTGCMFCMFGVHLEEQPNRFQRMQTTHPPQYYCCMKDWELGGLGLSRVLDYIGVPYKDYVLQLKDYEQISI